MLNRDSTEGMQGRWEAEVDDVTGTEGEGT